jgi:membrane-bound lytic murein transglycosylase F
MARTWRRALAAALLLGAFQRIAAQSRAASRGSSATPPGASASTSQAPPATPAIAPPATPAIAPTAAPTSAATPAKGALAKAAQVRASAQARDRYDATFKKYSKRYFGIAFDWRYFKAQAVAESGLDPDAQSRVGARGLMQLMPSTFEEIQSARPEFTSINDPEWNIAAGIMHDRYLWGFWAKDVPVVERRFFMFGSYNAGEGTIRRATQVAATRQLDLSAWPSIELVAPTVPRWRYQETLGYIRKIEATYDLFSRIR